MLNAAALQVLGCQSFESRAGQMRCVWGLERLFLNGDVAFFDDQTWSSEIVGCTFAVKVWRT